MLGSACNSANFSNHKNGMEIARFVNPSNLLLNRLGPKLLAVVAQAILALTAFAGLTSAQTVTTQVTLPNPVSAIGVNPATNTVYVTQGTNTLTAIDGATNTVTTASSTGTTGAGPMVVDTTFNNVYVINTGSGNISYYSFFPFLSSPLTFVGTFTNPNGIQPVALAMNSPVHKLYVANAGSNNVSVFSPTGTGGTWIVTSTIGVGTNPQALAIDTATHQIYVVNKGSNSVSVIDGSTDTVVATIAVGTSPQALAINTATNKIYVANTGSNNVTVITAPSNTTSTIPGIGSGPAAITVNATTNHIFVANTSSSDVAIINGTTNAFVNVGVQSGNVSGQAAISVDSATDIAYVSINGSDLTTLDPASALSSTPIITNLVTGAGANSAVAVNPVTHKAYVASFANATNGVAVVDGATNFFSTIPTGQGQASSIAVNPATNLVYISNPNSNNVTVLNGATNAIVTTVTTGTNPTALLVDQVRNLIYVANTSSDSVTVIDGVTNQTNTINIPEPASPDSLTYNPVLGKVYGASNSNGAEFSFLSNFNNAGIGFGTANGSNPIAAGTNPATGMQYNLIQGTSILEVNDESAPHSFEVNVCNTPLALDVNPVTNSVYVICADGNIDVVVGASGFFGGVVTTLHDPNASGLAAVAVNPLTNKIYVVNTGTANITIIDGATNSLTTLGVGNSPVSVAVNIASNKIYVLNQEDLSVSVIDGATNLVIARIPVSSSSTSSHQLAANPVTGDIFALNSVDASVTPIAENTVLSNGLQTTITPFTSNSTNTSTPTFTFTAANSINTFPVYAIFYQVDSQQGAWKYSNPSGSTFTDVALPLTPGLHTVYAYAVAGDEASSFVSSSATGQQSNPLVGSIASYSFLVAPPIAGVPFFPSDFGALNIGMQSPAQQPILINDGAAALNFTYAFTGANAADFTEVPFNGTDPLCNTLAGVLPAGSYCVVNVAFTPTLVTPESASLTFTDNSLGALGSIQTVALTGSGLPQLTVNISGNGGGKVTDNLASLNCTSAQCVVGYPVNTVVALTATPNVGSTFVGWTGACSGTGTCTVTMNQLQTVAAAFSTGFTTNCSGTASIWIGGPSGNWSNAANWSTGVVPNNGAIVCINDGHTPGSQVTLDANVSIGGLAIDAGSTLTIGTNQQLIVSGTISNSGQIIVFSNGNNTFLTFNGAVTLTGGGTVTLVQLFSNAQPILNNVNNGSLNNVNNLIEGSGQIGNNGLIFTNQAAGIVNANASFPLALNASGVVNLGQFQATAGGVMQVNVSVLNKNATISSTGVNSAMQFYSGTTIHGGSLTQSGGAFLGTTSNNTVTLDGSSQGSMTFTGLYTASNNSQTVVSGTVINTGSILVYSNNANTFLTFSGPVTLTGGGTVQMTQVISNGQPILNNINNGTVLNVNNFIQGSGQFGNNGLLITNQAAGVIIANNASAFPMSFNSGPLTNQGFIEATGRGILQFSVQIINQNSTISAASATSSVQLYSGTTVQGGMLNATSGGFLGTVANNTVTLDGSTLGQITLTGLYTGSNNSQTVVSGTVNNTGSILVYSNNANTFLTFSGPVTLTGGGTVLMTQVISNGQPILNNINNGAVLNVNNLIQGSGQFGNNGLLITNQAAGVINSNNSTGLPMVFGSGTVTNHGLIEATAGGIVQVSVLILNQGATFTASGATSAIQLFSGTTIRGGTLSAIGGAFVGTTLNNSVILDGATSGALTLVGTYTDSNNAQTFLLGTINNTGSILVFSNNANTFLTFNGTVTLSGGGTIQMTQVISNGQPILNNINNGTLLNVNNLIQGAGQLGNNGLLVTNQAAAVINANNSSGLPMAMNSGTVTNHGLIEATAGGVLQISVTMLNSGATITASGASSSLQLFINGIVRGGTLSSTGGAFLGTATGTTVTLDGSSQGALTLAGIFTVSNNSQLDLLGSINNTGTLLVLSNNFNSIVQCNGLVTLGGGGTVTLSQAISNGQPIVNNANNGTLANVNNLIQGSGQIGNNGLTIVNQAAGTISANGAFPLVLNAANIANQGLIIDDGASAPGTLTVNNFAQTPTGRFGVVIGGLTPVTQYSQWHDTATSGLFGSLDIRFANGFVPALGNQFTILTSNALGGTFSSINSPTLPAGINWSLAYTTQTVVLSVVSGAAGSSTLTVSGLGAGSGTITDDLGLINCTSIAGVVSGTCLANYTNNSAPTLTATPAAGSALSGWSTCTGVSTCAVTLNGNQSESATFVPANTNFTLTVTPTGTGTGNVTDNLQQINCSESAAIITGTCSATYPAGTAVILTETPTSPSTFGGWAGACTGSGACSVTLNSATNVIAAFVPPPSTVNLSYVASATPQTQAALYNCPSNPNPTPANPCTDPNAHQLQLTVPQVTTPFTLTVAATEVPPGQADGICQNGATPAMDFDCRFANFFTFQTLSNGDRVVPKCDPYANGNCVFYSVYFGTPGVEPPITFYQGPITWFITWNNESYIPPTTFPYQANNPRLFDDPDYPVSPTTPYGTSCTTPMNINGVPTNPALFCQFIFDITTSLDLTEPVDTGIGGRTKQFNDVVVAFPLANASPSLTFTVIADAALVNAGNPIGFTIATSNSSAPGTGTANAVTISDPLPPGTNTNWVIAPAYSGPGTCAITGIAGSQSLNCALGNMAPAMVASVHVVSATAGAGTYLNIATETSTNASTLSASDTTVVQQSILVFSGLTPSQSINVGTSSITLSGAISLGAAFPPSGESISITIGNATQSATIGSNGAFTVAFATANIPASGTPYPITYNYAGDSNFAAVSNSSTTLTVNSVGQTFFTLTLTEIGTGAGTVADNQQQINCSESGGVVTGTCSANYATGAVVTLTATPTSPSTFAGWGGACSGIAGCSVTMNSAQAVSASFAPPPATLPVSFVASTTPQAKTATYNCPSNTNPCTDPNAHELQLNVPQVFTPFTLTVRATEVPPNQANGICSNGNTVLNDFDCRFTSAFTFQNLPNGDKIVPLCDPYANGNCVFYSVYFGTPGTEPPATFYSGPIDWFIAWNNESFIPPATFPYQANNPRLFDDPDYAVSSTTPFGTNCSVPMNVGVPPAPTNPPISCQFIFDITTFLNTTAPVDTGIGGRTKQFNDVVVAFPLVAEPTLNSAADNATVSPSTPIGFTIGVSNTNTAATGPITAVTLTDPLPAGTGINWSISPAFAGPGTCAITGALGAQILNCAFGDLAAGASASVHVVSPTAPAGVYQNAATITANGQKLLTIATVTVNAAVPTFSNLTASQSITYGTSSISLSGTISSGTIFPATGETVSVSINGASQPATIAANGAFSTPFNTSAIPASATPYTITYAYAGDANLSTATDSSTKLTVNIGSQTITFAGTPATASYGSSFTVAASSTSALPVTITPSGVCSLSGSTVTITSGTGTCTLTASQAGNTNYFAATSVIRTVAAAKSASATAIISNAPNPSTPGQSVAISAKVTGTGTPTGSVIVTASTGETCTVTLASGAGSCSITFTTTGPRTLTAAYSGDANFIASSSAAVTQTVNAASASSLQISPSTVNFGNVYLGTLSTQNITLTNTGSSAVTISSAKVVAVNGAYSGDFFIYNQCPASLAEGASCVIEVGLLANPNHFNQQNAALSIVDSAAGSPQSVSLTGNVIDPAPSFSPTSLSFSKQKVRTSSTAKIVTLKNVGTSPLTLTAISIQGDFTLSSATTCAARATLAPSAACNIAVIFTPTATGKRTGLVTVRDNAATVTQTVALTGTGN
jgi:YVTN family beta-propeller protein